MYIKGLVNTKDQSNACMCDMMSKGSKEALTVLIVTHLTHIKRIESVLCIKWPLAPPKYAVLITFVIFNQFSIPKSFGKLRLGPFQLCHPMLYMLKVLKVILTFDPFNMLWHT